LTDTNEAGSIAQQRKIIRQERVIRIEWRRDNNLSRTDYPILQTFGHQPSNGSNLQLNFRCTRGLLKRMI
jgi:hypothetical protein